MIFLNYFSYASSFPDITDFDYDFMWQPKSFDSLEISSFSTSLITALFSNSLSCDFTVLVAVNHIQTIRNVNYMLLISWIASTIIPVPTAISRTSFATRT